jgi:hypothetical protein
MHDFAGKMTGFRTTGFLLASSLACVASSGALPAMQLAQQPAAPQLVSQALASEISATHDGSHPMRYLLRKSSPRLTTTKEMIETRDGLVARLVSVNDAPPSAADAEKEQARLDALMADPGKQRHRKQSEAADTERAMKVLRALPAAFLYQDAGPVASPAGTPEKSSPEKFSPEKSNIEKFTFVPNPRFNPPDLETQVLTQMTGELWIDSAHQRVVHLEGRLQSDVDFGWGVLGRLDKGGWIAIDQADVGGGVWRIVRFKMSMNGRVLFKTRNFDTTEEESHFAPVPAGLDYRKAIDMLREGQKAAASGTR